jgi:O-antigen/teichoic acid export membrane protein
MKLGGFGSKLFGIRLLTYGNRNADNLLIGKFAGAAALGVYSVAYNVMFTPVNRISMPLWGVVYPALVRMQDDLPRMRAAWLRSKRLSNALHAPVFFTILVVSPDLVAVLLGDKWSAAVPVVQLLCIAGLAHSVQNLNSAVVQARGNVGLVLRLQVFASIVTLAAFALGVQWGATGVAALYAVARWIIVPVDTWFTTRSVGFSFSEALLAGGSLLPLAAAAAGVAYLCRTLLVDAGVAPIVRLFVVGGISLLLYAALVLVIAPGLIRDLREILQRRRAGVVANA